MVKTATVSTFQAAMAAETDTTTATVTANGRTADLDSLEAESIVEDVLRAAFKLTMADQLQALNVEASCTAEMSLHMISERVRQAIHAAGATIDEPTDADIVAEANRIFGSFADNRAMPSQTPVASILEPRGPQQAENGTNPSNPSRNHILRVPSDAEFGEDDYFVSSSLKARAEVLRDRHPDLFEHLDRLAVVYLWKKTGGKAKGMAVYGKTTKPTGLLKLFSESAFCIVLSADHCRSAYYGDPEIEQLLFHEMLHTGEGETDEETGRGGGPQLVPHQLEIFHAEIEVYGLDAVILRDAAPLFRAAAQASSPNGSVCEIAQVAGFGSSNEGANEEETAEDDALADQAVS